jgi:hypothetical protein
VRVRLPDDVLADVDAWRSAFVGMKRSAAIRALINLGLRAPKAAEVRDPRDPEGRWVPGRTYKARAPGEDEPV